MTDIAAPTTKDGKIIDWSGALDAAKRLARVVGDTGFVAPEDSARQQYSLERAAEALNEIVLKLALRMPVDPPTLAARQIAAAFRESVDAAAKARGSMLRPVADPLRPGNAPVAFTAGGQHVAFCGDFASASPSTLAQLDRWARELAEAVGPPDDDGTAQLGDVVPPMVVVAHLRDSLTASLRARLASEFRSQHGAEPDPLECDVFQLAISKDFLVSLVEELSRNLAQAVIGIPIATPSEPSWIVEAFEALGVKAQGGTWTQVLAAIRDAIRRGDEGNDELRQQSREILRLVDVCKDRNVVIKHLRDELVAAEGVRLDLRRKVAAELETMHARARSVDEIDETLVDDLTRGLCSLVGFNPTEGVPT